MDRHIPRIMTAAALIAAALCTTSCDNRKFKIEGTITDAADSVLYLENMALDGPQRIDSTTLSAEGSFAFTHDAPQGAPEFYRLRIGRQIVNFAIDSTETVGVKASYPTMASAYTIEGGRDNQRIRELALKQIQLQARVKQIFDAPDLNATAVTDSILATVSRYKEDVTTNYIYKTPDTPSSYFALFQGIVAGNSYLMIIDPKRNVDDVKPISAVATSWDVHYPGSLRGENLHNIAIEAMKTRRILQAEKEGLTVDASKVTEAEIIDIVLPDNKGVTRRLTDLKGKVVLLDFHAFSAKGSMERIIAMRELYTKYHDRGLEIYQVSLDEDEHFWKTQVAALPWICVHDDGSATQSYLYQARALPLDYLINRDNVLVLGPQQIKDLDADIARLL